MCLSLPAAGAPSEKLACQAHEWWCSAARKAGIDLSGFCISAPLEQRTAWSIAQGLDNGAVLSRFSSKIQHSTDSQVQECVQFAASHGTYVPPEFICIDEAVSGRKSRRDGLDRVKLVLKQRLAKVLLVFKVSRLMRSAYKGFAFFQEEVVDEGLRAISVSQGIDTANAKTWKNLAYLHGMADEMLLETIADHVRSGLKSLFQAGFVTGALPVGYGRVKVPGPLTNRGRARTMPKVRRKVARLIKRHFLWHSKGLPIREGWRRWVAVGGPYDPRATSGHMTYNSYRRILANPRYTGVWAFGRKRNAWSCKADYNKQHEGPESEVVVLRCEKLRIISDKLFQKMQVRLAQLKSGPRGPRKQGDVQLWDTVTDCFYCDECNVRFFVAGTLGRSMGCKHGAVCPSYSAVRRDRAVSAVCDELADLIQRDADLIEAAICSSQQLDARADDSQVAQIADIEKRLSTLDSKIDDLSEVSGQGNQDARAKLKGKISAALLEQAKLNLELTSLRAELTQAREIITPEQVREALRGLKELLCDGASGKLGPDCVYLAADAFRKLVGDKIRVHVERRAARQRTNVRGTFIPRLLQFVRSEFDQAGTQFSPELPEVEVWLRKPPKLDRLARQVHEMIDVRRLSFRQAAAALQAQGHQIISGVVWQAYRRYYEMLGQPMPSRPYNNGQSRKPK